MVASCIYLSFEGKCSCTICARALSIFLPSLSYHSNVSPYTACSLSLFLSRCHSVSWSFMCMCLQWLIWFALFTRAVLAALCDEIPAIMKMINLALFSSRVAKRRIKPINDARDEPNECQRLLFKLLSSHLTFSPQSSFSSFFPF